LLAINAATLYVDPGDRERVQRLMEAGGSVQDFALETRTGDGGTVWVRINSRSVRESDTDCYEGILEDITHQRRAEEAERPAESLRAVAKLANAAAHEINNPLAVITGRLELLRRHLATPEQQARFDQALVAAKRLSPAPRSHRCSISADRAPRPTLPRSQKSRSATVCRRTETLRNEMLT